MVGGGSKGWERNAGEGKQEELDLGPIEVEDER